MRSVVMVAVVFIVVAVTGCGGGGVSSTKSNDGGANIEQARSTSTSAAAPAGVETEASEGDGEGGGRKVRPAYEGEQFECPVTVEEVSAVVGTKLVVNPELDAKVECGFLTSGFGPARSGEEEDTISVSFSTELGNRLEENRAISEEDENDPELALDCETSDEPKLGREAFAILCGRDHVPGDGYQTSAQYIFVGPNEQLSWSVTMISGGEIPTAKIPAMLDQLIYAP